MAKKQQENGVVSVHEIPAEVIGAVVLAELAQIEADAETHQDIRACNRIHASVERLRQIARNEMSPDVKRRIVEMNALTSGLPKQ